MNHAETMSNPAMPGQSRVRVPVHSLGVRIFHWLNAIAIVVMIMSGWRIYNASPLFSFRFPREATLGGWLGGALQWHFAAMWLLGINLLAYLLIGLLRGHFRRAFFPVSPGAILRDLRQALRGGPTHETGRYNAVQKAAYLGVLAAIVVTILSGLAVWKPVQLQELAALMGGYEGARLVHFAGMTAISVFIVVHLALVLLVPGTLLPMILGWTRKPAEQTRVEGHVP